MGIIFLFEIIEPFDGKLGLNIPCMILYQCLCFDTIKKLLSSSVCRENGFCATI
jgi:hypothetical protein